MDTLLAERYGTGRRTRGRLVALVAGVLVLLAAAWLVWVISFQSTPEVQSTLRTYKVVDDHTVRAVVLVRPRSAQVRASCKLRAYGEDHTVVGERNFLVSGVRGSAARQVVFRTERRATSVELAGCTSDRQNRSR